MGIGVSIFLLALGAILTFAVQSATQVSGIDLNTVGIILMIAGLIGLGTFVALMNQGRGLPWSRRAVRQEPGYGARTTVYEDDVYRR